MMTYKVIVTDNANDDLKRYIRYIVEEKKNPQAARSIMEDFRYTREMLSFNADNLAKPESVILCNMGLMRYNFKRHNYFLLFKKEDDKIFITNIFHSSEDFENKL